ncbi:MAG: hypothetical protein LQ339_008774 [Xanthoria mediterranea]|nr:MAG: hypothetical protein LQ339_008774 [Xanthoria mediterranea]
MVHITLEKFTGYLIPPGAIPAFISTAISSLDRTAAQECGPTAPLGPDRKTIGFSNYGVTMSFNDITIHNPEVGGGRLRFGEVRAVYQGIGDVIQQLGYEECHTEAWRMVNGRSQKFKVKILMSGYLVNAHSMVGLLLSSGHNVTQGNNGERSEPTVTS